MDQSTINRLTDIARRIGRLEGIVGTTSRGHAQLMSVAEIIKDIPWDDVHSLKISWELLHANDGTDLVELVPNMDLVMKGGLLKRS